MMKGKKLLVLTRLKPISVMLLVFGTRSWNSLTISKKLLIQHGYKDRVKVNNTACDLILNMLRKEFPVLEKSESSSRQQVGVDLKTAFDRYYNPHLKSRYPRYKSKNNEKTGFWIMNNNNNVRLQKKQIWRLQNQAS